MTFTIAANQGQMGGGEVMLFNIAEAARELGRDVTVVAPEEPGDVVAEARRRGFRTVAIHGSSTAAYLRNLCRWDASERRGLLWCNGLRPAFATSGHGQRVVHLHQLPVGKLKALASAATRGAAAVVVPSQWMADRVPGARVMWNWFSAAPVEAGRGVQDGPTTIGFMGRMTMDKGIGVLAEALNQLEQDHPGQFELLVAGESRFSSEDDQRAMLAALDDIAAPVTRAGWLDPSDFFRRADVVVMPSVFPESFGLVAAEAQAAGVPVVVSDAGALPEVVGTDHPFIVPSGDTTALAEAIARAADAAGGDSTARARQRSRDQFGRDAGRARLESILADLEHPATQAPVALAHDYLTQRGGAERVALFLTSILPEAELITSVHNPDTTYQEFREVNITTSLLNRIPLLRSHFRLGLPLYGPAFSLTSARRDARVTLASSTGFAHGVRTKGAKVVYCHSPARFLYLVEDYLGGPWWKSPTGWALMALRPALVAWDQRAARSADAYIANSTVVQERIQDVYGIEARVVHPPYGIDPAGRQDPIGEAESWPRFHVLVSRLMPYKNVDVAIEAFRGMPDEHLLIIGRGPLKEKLAANLPPNVAMVEGISDEQLRWAYAHAEAVIAPSREDFGLTPVEGFSMGTPALALRAGGYLETVVEGTSGWFFEEATPEAIRRAVNHLVAHPIPAERVVSHAEKFSPERFARTMQEIVEEYQ